MKLPSKLLAILVGGLLGLWISEWHQHNQSLKHASSNIEETRQRYQANVRELREDTNNFRDRADKLSNEIYELIKKLTHYFAKLGINCTDQKQVTEHLDLLLTQDGSLDKAFEEMVMGDMHCQWGSYRKLRHDGELITKYRKQIDLASVFCRLSKDRFWATSTDRISSFQMHNYYYYEALIKGTTILQQRSQSTQREDDLPRFARVFIGELHSFAADLIDNPGVFFELYRMHVLWGKSKNPRLAPIRFFIDIDPNGLVSSDSVFAEYKTLLHQRKIEIKDFMLVDDQLVYGREGEYSEESVTLHLSTEKEIIEVYEHVFPKIWHNTISIEELSNRVLGGGYSRFSDREHQDFTNLCRIAESKLDIHSDYVVRNSRSEVMFPGDSRIGANFFDRVCYHIGNSQSLIVAVDRADRKVGDVLKAWLNSIEYKKFHNACASAVKRGAQVHRLYILEKLTKKAFNKSDARQFIELNANAGIQIGFVPADLLPEKGLESEYMYDFILVNMPRGPFVGDDDFINSPQYNERFLKEKNDCLGFELLGNQSFIAAGLKWEDNLIAKDQLLVRLAKFRDLWTNSHVIKLKGFQTQDVDELMRELFV